MWTFPNALNPFLTELRDFGFLFVFVLFCCCCCCCYCFLGGCFCFFACLLLLLLIFSSLFFLRGAFSQPTRLLADANRLLSVTVSVCWIVPHSLQTRTVYRP